MTDHRLAVLHELDILDTPAEPAYDEIAKLASVCCQSTIAAVNFVDDTRHWTKAIVGVESGPGGSVAANLSFCAATVATEGGLLSVGDTLRSERWKAHPSVTGGPLVRFYAGATVVLSGEPVGVVCVFGDEPRQISGEQEQALVMLARQTSTHLEMRRRNATLRGLADGLKRSEARLRQAEEMVGSGCWELSLDGVDATWSDGFHRIHGVPVGQVPDRETYLSRVHPEDRKVLREALRRCTVDGDVSVEYRVSRTDGALRKLRVQAELVLLGAEEEPFVRGAALDVTDERAGFDAAPIGMLVTAPDDLRLLRVNEALCAMLGRTREELLTMRIGEITHPDDRVAAAATRTALIDGAIESYQGEKRYLRPDGTVVWATVHITPVRDPHGSVRSFSVQVIDITGRRMRSQAIDAARLESLRRLAIASEYRDTDTHEHTERVGHLAEVIGRAVGVPERNLGLLRQAAQLHDIGKIGIPDAILLKPGRLTPEERLEMERHTLIGAEILSGSESPVLRMAEEISRTHHERWDGNGYPQKLRGDRIPLFGRIVAVADVFDALTHTRPYKEAWTVDRAVAHICRESARQFDPGIVAAFETVDHVAFPELDPAQARSPSPVMLPSTEQAWAAEDGEQASLRDHAASERNRSATDRDQAAARRDLFEANADERTSTRDRAASVRELAAADRDQTATDRDETQADADHRGPGPIDYTRDGVRGRAADDRRRAAADRTQTASDRAKSRSDADQRRLNRDHAVADRVLAAADRDQTAADCVAVALERDLANDELRRWAVLVSNQ